LFGNAKVNAYIESNFSYVSKKAFWRRYDVTPV